VSLTLGSTSEVSLANRKILSNRCLTDFGYLPATVDVDRTMEHTSLGLKMHAMLVVPLVLYVPTSVHVGLMEVVGQIVACYPSPLWLSWRVRIFVRWEEGWSSSVEIAAKGCSVLA
jgi:hypothetical protein